MLCPNCGASTHVTTSMKPFRKRVCKHCNNFVGMTEEKWTADTVMKSKPAVPYLVVQAPLEGVVVAADKAYREYEAKLEAQRAERRVAEVPAAPIDYKEESRRAQERYAAWHQAHPDGSYSDYVAGNAQGRGAPPLNTSDAIDPESGFPINSHEHNNWLLELNERQKQKDMLE